jgi:hypothetical protein
MLFRVAATVCEAEFQIRYQHTPAWEVQVRTGNIFTHPTETSSLTGFSGDFGQLNNSSIFSYMFSPSSLWAKGD